MARKVSVAVAKAHFSDLLRRVSKGETVVVERRGAPVAVIRAFESKDGEPEKSWVDDLWGVAAELPEFEKIMKSVVSSRRTSRQRKVDLDT